MEKAPIAKEVEMVPIIFLPPYCHNKAMLPVYTFRDETKGLYTEFWCDVCNHYDSRLVAVPNKKGEQVGLGIEGKKGD